MVVAMLIAIVAIIVSYAHGTILPIEGSKGLGLPSANEWISLPLVSMIVNGLLCISIAVMMILLNKRYNVIRSMSSLYATIFIIIQASTPELAGQLYGGTILCLVVLIASAVLFSTFGLHNETHSVFLMFFMLSLGAMTQYAYLFFIPVFLVGMIQMRTMSLRAFTATIIGIITPPWILWGLGIIEPDAIEIPRFTSVFSAITQGDIIRLAVTVGFTLLVTIVAGVVNFMKIYSYNSRARAYNGFVGILAIATAILLIVDYTNFAIYVPMLNYCAAMQVGHMFVINHKTRSYIPLTLLILVYLSFYIWSYVL